MNGFGEPVNNGKYDRYLLMEVNLLQSPKPYGKRVVQELQPVLSLGWPPHRKLAGWCQGNWKYNGNADRITHPV